MSTSTSTSTSAESSTVCGYSLASLGIKYLFLIPLSPKIDVGRRHFWRVMVVKITNLAGNGRQNYKSKNRSGMLLYCAGTYGITYTCGQKSKGGGEKQLIDLEWPYHSTNGHNH